ncbi:MAG: HDOD domain-containing protein [Candidatus Polarisedimenticolia bacterium]|nr:HDOD domain-containing protein [bacterium]
MTPPVPHSPQDVIRNLLAGAGELPVLPDVAVRILEEMKSPNVNARKLAEFVSKDPVLASSVLRVANSALYGGRSEITDLPYAMVRVGLQQVKNLVLALVLRSRMADPQVYGTLGASLMEHALAVAFGARLVADMANIDSQESFLCGLLHDFGRLALIKALRESAGIRRGDLAPEQMLMVDQYHEEAGAMLAANWRLPEAVVVVARRHHHPEQATDHKEMVAAVAFADQMAHKLGLGGDAEPAIDLNGHPAVKILNLKQDEVADLVGHMPGLFATARAAMYA